MIPRPFEYHAPRSLPDAVALLGRYGDDAKLLAGGHSLLPMMKLRFASPAHLVDLGRIDALKGIRQVGDAIHIGAMTTENELIWSALVRDRLPLLAEGARQIADPQVRYKGTIGGDIAHGDPGNDHPALMLALGASFAVTGPRGDSVIAADAFFVSTYTTRLGPQDVLTEIRIPIPPPGSGGCYAKLKRKTGDFATAAAAVQLQLKGDAVAEVRIALTNVAPTAVRVTAAEAALKGRRLDDAAIAEAAKLAMQICEPVADLRGDAEYKTAMAGEMTRRALRTAGERARG